MCCFSRRYESYAVDGFFCSYRFPSRHQSNEGSGDNNSVWAIIAGISKNYVLPFDYVLYEMSFANVQMYNAVLPTYDSESKKDKKKKDNDIIWADDPKNKAKVDDFINHINGK